MENLKRLFQSRKALIFAAGALAALANELTGRMVSQETVLGILGLAGLLIFGIAWEDSAEKKTQVTE